jgi:cold shock CspA family protein
MTRVKYFWREGESRKIFQGTIKNLTSSEGFIQDHNVTNWEGPVYFTPRQQDNKDELKTGLDVRFELGFSLKGPQAFELELV